MVLHRRMGPLRSEKPTLDEPSIVLARLGRPLAVRRVEDRDLRRLSGLSSPWALAEGEVLVLLGLENSAFLLLVLEPSKALIIFPVEVALFILMRVFEFFLSQKIRKNFRFSSSQVRNCGTTV